jgi:DNA helicase HerA-like ATPase
MSDAGVGIVLGHQAATSQAFTVGLRTDETLEVDELVAVRIADPGGEVTAYGLVTESMAQLEGATLPSDTAVIAEGAMPGELVRTAEVQVVRMEPERWVAPHPGAAVRRARGEDRRRALYEDTMTRTMAAGLARDGEPLLLDLDFLDGAKGGHVSISGISGVAIKTSTALGLVRLVLAHPDMRRRARALVFNVKGEDLLHLDRPNRAYAARVAAGEDLEGRWRILGLSPAAPFPEVAVWAPARADGAADCETRHDVRTFGWSPFRFAADGLLRFCFADADDARSQLGFVEERVRSELVRRAVPVAGHPGALGLVQRPDAGDPEHRGAASPGELDAGPFADLAELVGWLTREIDADALDARWTGQVAPGTLQAFARRLRAAAARLGPLVRAGADPIPRGPEAADEPPVAVVHLTRLHEFAQRFVVGTLLAQTFSAKEGGVREPIELVVLDELNRYAPREGRSPIRDLLVDIAQRGRSLGVILIGCQQQASLVAPEVTQNAAVRISGRLDPAEAERAEYGWLGPAARARARLLTQGRVIVSQPSVPAALPVELPFPPWATAAREVDRAAGARRALATFGG